MSVLSFSPRSSLRQSRRAQPKAVVPPPLPNIVVAYAVQEAADQTFKALRKEQSNVLPQCNIADALASVAQLLGLDHHDTYRLLQLDLKNDSFAVAGMSYTEFIACVRCCAVLHGSLALLALPALGAPDLSSALYQAYLLYASQRGERYSAGTSCHCWLLRDEDQQPRMLETSFIRMCEDAGFLQPQGPLALDTLRKIWGARASMCEHGLCAMMGFGEVLRTLAVMAGLLQADVMVPVAALGLVRMLPDLKLVMAEYKFAELQGHKTNLAEALQLVAPHLDLAALMAAARASGPNSQEQLTQHVMLLAEQHRAEGAPAAAGVPAHAHVHTHGHPYARGSSDNGGWEEGDGRHGQARRPESAPVWDSSSRSPGSSQRYAAPKQLLKSISRLSPYAQPVTGPARPQQRGASSSLRQSSSSANNSKQRNFLTAGPVVGGWVQHGGATGPSRLSHSMRRYDAANGASSDPQTDEEPLQAARSSSPERDLGDDEQAMDASASVNVNGASASYRGARRSTGAGVDAGAEQRLWQVQQQQQQQLEARLQAMESEGREMRQLLGELQARHTELQQQHEDLQECVDEATRAAMESGSPDAASAFSFHMTRLRPRRSSSNAGEPMTPGLRPAGAKTASAPASGRASTHGTEAGAQSGGAEEADAAAGGVGEEANLHPNFSVVSFTNLVPRPPRYPRQASGRLTASMDSGGLAASQSQQLASSSTLGPLVGRTSAAGTSVDGAGAGVPASIVATLTAQVRQLQERVGLLEAHELAANMASSSLQAPPPRTHRASLSGAGAAVLASELSQGRAMLGDGPLADSGTGSSNNNNNPWLTLTAAELLSAVPPGLAEGAAVRHALTAECLFRRTVGESDRTRRDSELGDSLSGRLTHSASGRVVLPPLPRVSDSGVQLGAPSEVTALLVAMIIHAYRVASDAHARLDGWARSAAAATGSSGSKALTTTTAPPAEASSGQVVGLGGSSSTGSYMPPSPSSRLGRPPRPAEPGSTRYVAAVHTGSAKGSGTDALVYVTLHGRDGSTDEMLLPSSTDSFTRGAVDVFELESSVGDIGPVERITVRNGGGGLSPMWQLDKLEVEDVAAGRIVTVQCQQWLHNEQQVELEAVEAPSARGSPGRAFMLDTGISPAAVGGAATAERGPAMATNPGVVDVGELAGTAASGAAQAAVAAQAAAVQAEAAVAEVRKLQSKMHLLQMELSGTSADLSAARSLHSKLQRELDQRHAEHGTQMEALASTLETMAESLAASMAAVPGLAASAARSAVADDVTAHDAGGECLQTTLEATLSFGGNGKPPSRAVSTSGTAHVSAAGSGAGAESAEVGDGTPSGGVMTVASKLQERMHGLLQQLQALSQSVGALQAQAAEQGEALSSVDERLQAIEAAGSPTTSGRPVRPLSVAIDGDDEGSAFGGLAETLEAELRQPSGGDMSALRALSVAHTQGMPLSPKDLDAILGRSGRGMETVEEEAASTASDAAADIASAVAEKLTDLEDQRMLQLLSAMSDNVEERFSMLESVLIKIARQIDTLQKEFRRMNDLTTSHSQFMASPSPSRYTQGNNFQDSMQNDEPSSPNIGITPAGVRYG